MKKKNIERHCKHWQSTKEYYEQFTDDLLKSWPFDLTWRKDVELGQSIASPGACLGQPYHQDLNKYRGKTISECICYTCPHNTLPMGQGFNGQGA